MRNQFVITDNVRRTVSALAALEEGARVNPGRGLAIIDGRTGTGKTETMKWYYVNNRASVYLRSHRNWTSLWMVEDLASAILGETKRTMRANFRELIEELKRRPRLIIIDEADRILKKENLLETVRDLHDFTNAPIALVSEGQGREMVARKSARFWRRVSQVVEFTNLSVADVQVIAKELADLEIPKQQAEVLHQDAGGGVFGEVMVRLGRLEELVKANPGQGVSHKVVELALRERKAAHG